MKRIFILAILLIGTTCYSLQAQEKWSLEKCITFAKEHNIELRKKILNAQIRKNNNKQAKLNLLPNLGGYVSHNFSWGRSISYSTNTYENQDQQGSRFYLNSEVSLFKGFQKRNTIKQTNLDLLASLQDVEKGKEDLALNITSYYLNILFKKELLQIAQEQLKITQLQIQRTKTLVEAGTLAKGTLMEQIAQAAREEVTVVTTQNELDLAKLNLVQLLDLESPEDFDIQIPELPVINANQSILNPKSVFLSALEFRPEIKAAKFRFESAQKGVLIAKGERSPNLSLSGQWNTSYSNTLPDREKGLKEMKFKDQLKNNAYKAFGFSLNIPIFSRGLINRNINNAKIQIQQSQLDLENTQNILRKEVQQAHANASGAMKKFFSSELAVSSSQEAFRYTDEKFNLGLVNSVEYNQAKNNLVKSKSDLLQAKYDYIFRTKILDFYNGIPIKL